jgi:hypothetical protein
MTPNWVHEPWRRINYPAELWYVGFAENTSSSEINIAESLKSLERDALNKMAESVRVRVSGASVVENRSQRASQSGGKSESRSGTNYRQTIYAETNAEITGASVYSYHDTRNGKIYAIAAVKKSDLASYYASKAEFYIQIAENIFNEAKQMVLLGRKGEANKKFADSGRNLDELGQYLNLLNVVDIGSSSTAKRLFARETELRRQISAAQAEAQESISFYIESAETIDNANVDIVTSKIKSAISKNGYRTADRPKDAAYRFWIEVMSCNVAVSGNRTFCYACVKAEVTNIKTGKSEGHVNFTGPKTGWMDRETACIKAFENAADELWDKIKTDIKIFR